MAYSREAWAEKRKGGIVRYLLIDGIIFTGGVFAVLMQIVGLFLLRKDGQTFGDYLSSPITWGTFFLHATLFGLIIGFINWRRNEAAFNAAGK